MNRTVLITGAAIRVGRAIASRLARAGWDVVVHANRSAREADALCGQLESLGRRAWRVAGDLQTVPGAEAVFAAALAAAGELDALVNNASVFERQPLAGAAAADFDRMWRINALAPVLLTQRLYAHLAARGATGCVINLLDRRDALPALQEGAGGLHPRGGPRAGPHAARQRRRARRGPAP